jgi:hypothetical protein
MRIRLAIRKLVARKNSAIVVALFLISIIPGYFLSIVPAPLLHYVLYRDINSEIRTALLVIPEGAYILFIYFGAKRLFSLTRKKAFKALFFGTSLTSFALGLKTFVEYPEMLSSSGYGWLTGGVEVHFFGNVDLSAIAFFIATILWDILLGSLFAALQIMLT